MLTPALFPAILIPQFYSMIQKRIRVSALLAQLPSTPVADAPSGPSIPHAANASSMDSIQALRAQIAQQNAASAIAQQQVLFSLGIFDHALFHRDHSRVPVEHPHNSNRVALQSSALAAQQRGAHETNDSFALLMHRTAMLKQKLATVPAPVSGAVAVTSSQSASSNAMPAPFAPAPAPAPQSAYGANTSALQATLQRLQALQTSSVARP
jgi:hypothetical protein